MAETRDMFGPAQFPLTLGLQVLSPHILWVYKHIKSIIINSLI